MGRQGSLDRSSFRYCHKSVANWLCALTAVLGWSSQALAANPMDAQLRLTWSAESDQYWQIQVSLIPETIALAKLDQLRNQCSATAAMAAYDRPDEQTILFQPRNRSLTVPCSSVPSRPEVAKSKSSSKSAPMTEMALLSRHREYSH